MINFKKMDDEDFIFVSRTLKEKEEKEFSEFLKLKKAKSRKVISVRKSKSLLTK